MLRVQTIEIERFVAEQINDFLTKHIFIIKFDCYLATCQMISGKV